MNIQINDSNEVEIGEIRYHGEVVKAANSLFQSRIIAPNAEAMRFLAICISTLKTKEDCLESKRISIPFNDLKNLLVDHRFVITADDIPGKTYAKWKSACLDLVDTKAEITCHERKNDETIFKNRFLPFFIEVGISYAEKNEKNRYLTVEFNPKFDKILICLKKCFTKVNLSEFLKLKNLYSQKIFLLLESWKNLGYKKVLFKDLLLLLFLEEKNIPKSYIQYKHFNQKILLTSKNEIISVTSLLYDYKKIIEKCEEYVIFYFPEFLKTDKDKRNELEFLISDQKNAVSERIKISRERKKEIKLSSYATNCARLREGICDGKGNKKEICEYCKVNNISENMRKIVQLGNEYRNN